ncbi:aldolase/citrate lyase family protein [Paraherbaspirillum soli]|uniref:Aldolase/citrate lyase family protein n=1 Tax=Paraherbaspirillum soli TaxID=631222 RepID=A0ABW0MDJ3_9BURK
MDMPRNGFKQRLKDQHLQLGLFLGLAHPLAAEILAGCGFDFLLIDAEHGPNDLRSVQAQLQAIAAYPVQAVVRPPQHDSALIKQLLGIGVQTLLAPMVDSAAQAKALVAAMRYPPNGMRGVGTGLERGARWNGIDDYLAQADAEMCLMVQVESRTGIANLAAILQVEGVDGVFIGPADLAASMGHPGQTAHPEVKTAIEGAIATIRAAGKAAGIFCADSTLAAAYRAGGCNVLAVGADTSLLRNAALDLVNTFKPASGSAAGASY